MFDGNGGSVFRRIVSFDPYASSFLTWKGNARMYETDGWMFVQRFFFFFFFFLLSFQTLSLA